MRSLVREAAGIAFEGAADAESFILADVQHALAARRDEVSLLFSKEGMVVVAPLPDGSFRIVATMENAPETPGVADIAGPPRRARPVGRADRGRGGASGARASASSTVSPPATAPAGCS